VAFSTVRESKVKEKLENIKKNITRMGHTKLSSKGLEGVGEVLENVGDGSAVAVASNNVSSSSVSDVGIDLGVNRERNGDIGMDVCDVQSIDISLERSSVGESCASKGSKDRESGTHFDI